MSRHLVLILTSALVCGVGRVAARQPVEEYLALQAAYRSDPEAAAARLVTWPRSAAEMGVSACLRQSSPTSATFCTVRQRITAAMMHTDVALMQMEKAPGDAEFHFGLASGLLARIREDEPFVPRWVEFVAMEHVSRGLFLKAGSYAQGGVQQFPRDWRLRLTLGRIAERQELVALIDPRTDADASDLRRFRGLRVAADAYRAALTLNPGSAVIQLHLGWLHVLQRDGRAREELEAALQRATDTDTRYLARLFRGAHAESEDRLEDAVREFEAARAVSPQYQAACTALSQAEDALGRVARARSIAAECVTMEREDDPWHYHRLAVPHPGLLEWLHAEARRP